MSEFINLEDLTEEQAAGLDGIDDPEAIMALLNGEKPEESTEPKEIEPKEEPQEENKPEDKTPAEDQEKAASDSDKKEDVDGESSDAEDNDEDDLPEGVMTKDGKRVIPYKVLEATRSSVSSLKEQLNKVQTELEQERQSKKSTAELLAAKGIDLEAIQKGDDVTEEMLAEIDEADEGIGKVVRHLMAREKMLSEKLDSLNTKSEPAANDDPPEVAAFKANPDLSNWIKNDQDRWDLACHYDDILQKLPEWKDKPPAERFAEAVKRTKTDFGDLAAEPNGKENPTQQKQKTATEKVDVDEALKNAETRPPSSLTDLGQPTATEKSKTQQLADIDDDDELISKMDTMSDADLSVVLAEALGL